MPPERPKSTGKSVIVPIRMSRQLRGVFKEAARQQGLTLSAWIRRAAILQRKREVEHS